MTPDPFQPKFLFTFKIATLKSLSFNPPLPTFLHRCAHFDFLPLFNPPNAHRLPTPPLSAPALRLLGFLCPQVSCYIGNVFGKGRSESPALVYGDAPKPSVG